MKQAFLTVDVECHDIRRENQYIWGRCKSGEAGLRRILEMGKKHGIPINFFLDIPEVLRYGENYLTDIIDAISQYDQPVYLHLHPNYVTGDESRTFLWQYSPEEQERILKTGRDLYVQYLKTEPKAFRAGRYGVDAHTYEAIRKHMPRTIDVSYLAENGKMCRLTPDEFGAKNIASRYQDVRCIPNNSFCTLKTGSRSKRITVDASQIRYGELNRFLKAANGRNVVLTMHSWHFIGKWFFLKDRVWLNKGYLARFDQYVTCMQQKGYRFARIEDAEFDFGVADFDLDECQNGLGFVRSLFYNFFRFQEIAKLTPKYFYFYCVVYLTACAMAAMVLQFI